MVELIKVGDNVTMRGDGFSPTKRLVYVGLRKRGEFHWYGEGVVVGFGLDNILIKPNNTDNIFGWNKKNVKIINNG
jgi:hypothetical protein